MKISSAIVILLLAVPASAYTPQETAEIQKVQFAIMNLTNGLHHVGVVMANPNLGHGAADVNRALFHDELNQISNALRQCAFAFSWLGQVQPTVGEPGTFSREHALTQAFSFLDVCQTHAENARDTAGILAATVNTGWGTLTNNLDDAIALLDSFDRSLGYVEWQQEFYPAIVAPHGTYIWAIHKLERAWRYMFSNLLTQNLMPSFIQAQTMSPAAVTRLGHLMQRMATSMSLEIRVWGMDYNVIHPLDQSVIDGDVVAGNNLRPPSFFRVQRQIELLGVKKANHIPPHTSGRSHDSGVAKFLAAMGLYGSQYFHELLVANASAGNFAALGLHGQQFTQDFTDGWGDQDELFQSYIGLFHGFPGAPPGGDVTCGPGTHQEGGQCLPDSITCPTFVASIVLLDGVTAQAQCLETP